MLKNMEANSSNPLGYVLHILGSKWKPYIIWYLSESEGKMRYSELKRRIPFEISHKVFSQQLKELVDEGLVDRDSIPMEENGNKPHVEYALTEKGRSLSSVVFMLHDWGSIYGDFGGKTGLKQSRGVVGDDRVYYTSHMWRHGGNQDRSSLGDVIVWMRNEVDKTCIA